MSRADAYLLLRRYKHAARLYREVLKLAPGHPRARYRLAFCLRRMGQTVKAFEELESTLKAAPKYLPAHLEMARIYLGKKAYKQADEVLGRAMRLLPDRVRLLVLRARVARMRAEAAGGGPNQFKLQALKYLAEARQVVGTRSVWRRRIALEEERARYGRAGRLLYQARRALARQRPKRALKLLAAVLTARPHLAVAHYLRGRALASGDLNRLNEAIAAFKKAGKMKQALLALGDIYYEKGEVEDAEDWYKKAIRIDPKFQRAHYQLALVAKELGEYQQALASWRKVTLLDPRSKLGKLAATKIQVMTGNVRTLAEGEVLDPASERRLGQRFIERFARKWGYVKDEKTLERLNDIARKLIAVSDRGAERLRYEVRIVNRRAVNAITFPGGKILFFKGLIDFVKKELDDSDDAYAAILGHEIAHAALRHGLMKAKVFSARQSLTATGFRALSTLRSLLSGFSRANEFEADQYGALYMYRAGFSPAMALRFHERMIARREIPPGMGHPPHGERLERLREYLLGLRAKIRTFERGMDDLKNKRWNQAIQHFEVFLGVFPESRAARNNLGLAMLRKALRQIPAGMYKKSTDIDPDAKIPALTLRSAGVATEGKKAIDRPLLREAISEFQIALRSDSLYFAAHLNLGAALLDLGADRKTARKHLEVAVRLSAKSSAARNNLAVADLLSSDLAGGIARLKKLTVELPTFPDAWYNLGIASAQQGRKKQAKAALLRYLELDKASGWARAAREQLKKL